MIASANRLILNCPKFQLIPLNFEEEVLYSKCDPELFCLLGMKSSTYEIPPELKHVIHSFILPLFKIHPSLHLYFTSWLIIDSVSHSLLGDMSFKGLPTARGRVEVGYGLFEQYRNNGIMTVALETLCEWASKQKIVKEITAETLISNLPSSRVLEKNDFKKYKNEHPYRLWIKYVQES